MALHFVFIDRKIIDFFVTKIDLTQFEFAIFILVSFVDRCYFVRTEFTQKYAFTRVGKEEKSSQKILLSLSLFTLSSPRKNCTNKTTIN
jgi:hypothetical protein